jgi:hypothetical protein
MHRQSRNLVIILVVLVVVVYIRAYTQPNPEFKVLQASITAFKPSHLFEKSPMIINEPVVDPIALKSTLFRWLYVKSVVTDIVDSDRFMKNRARYRIVYPTSGSSTIWLVHPKHRASKEKEQHAVAFPLKKNQCVIIPMHWWFKVLNTGGFHAVVLYDIISLFIG